MPSWPSFQFYPFDWLYRKSDRHFALQPKGWVCN